MPLILVHLLGAFVCWGLVTIAVQVCTVWLHPRCCLVLVSALLGSAAREVRCAVPACWVACAVEG